MVHLLLNPTTYLFSWYAIPTFAAAAVLLLLGGLVLIRERGSLVSVLFFLIALTTSTWFFAFSWMYSTNDEGVAHWWAKAAYLGVPFIPSALYHFTVVALRVVERYQVHVRINWLISAFFVVANLSTNALIAGVHRYWWGYYPRYGWLGVLFLVFFFSLLLHSLSHYWMEYRRARPGRYRNHVKWLMVSLVGAYLASVDFLPKYGVALYPFGYVAVVAWLVFVERAIWRYQFVDLTPAFAAEPIIRTMGDALLVFDHEGVVQFTNQASCRLLGRSDSDIIGRSIFTVSPGLFPQDKREALIRSGAGLRYETVYTAPYGRLLVLDISASAIQDRNGQMVGIVWIARDITDRRTAEEALRQNEQQLRQALQEREELSQDLHDNIIQMIYAVGLNLEECRQLAGKNPAAVRKKLESAIDGLNGVIRDVRSYVTRDAHEILGVRQLRAELVKLVKTMEAPNLLRFRLNIAPDAVNQLTAEEMRQVLFMIREAMSNSLRHSGGKKGLVSIHAQEGLVHIEVRDDGVGFDLEKRAGNGHGLAHIEARAKKIGARLQVVSKSGVGTTVIIDIPKGSRHVSTGNKIDSGPHRR